MTISLPTKQEGPLTPASCITIFAKLLRYAAEEKKVVQVTGMYQARGMKSYGGVYYDMLADGQTDHVLTIKVPDLLRTQLSDGALVTVEGALDRALKKDGSITMQLLVSNVLGSEQVIEDPKVDGTLRLLQQKMTKGMLPVEQRLTKALYAGKAPRIALVFGEQAIVDQDVDNALGAAQGKYDLVEFRANMQRVEELLDVMEEIEEGSYDAVALVRGGGSGMEVFDHLGLGEMIVRMHTPFIAALGHASDHSLVEQLADMVCTTPTALGVWLRKIVEESVEEQAASRAHLLDELQKQFATQRTQELELFEKERTLLTSQYHTQIETLEQRMKVLMGVSVAALVLGLLLGWLLG